MATYVELVLIGDNEKCRAVLALMGWETKEDQDEVLEELSDESNKQYLVHYENTINKKPKIAEYDDFEVLYTIGSSEGNRWYPVDIPGFRDVDGNCWVDEKIAEDTCC